jgi:hypothetical protein
LFLVMRSIFIAVIISCFVLLFDQYRYGSFTLEVEGELPYGSSVEHFKDYINENINHNVSFITGVYALLDQTRQYDSISLKKKKPFNLAITLVRKKAIALINDDVLLMDDLTLASSINTLSLPYTVQIYSLSQLNKQELYDLIIFLKKVSFDQAKVNIQAMGDIQLIDEHHNSIFLPNRFALEKLQQIYEYYQGKFPDSYQIDARYEKGFVLNKKASARI